MLVELCAAIANDSLLSGKYGAIGGAVTKSTKERECVCCREIPQFVQRLQQWQSEGGEEIKCITQHPGFRDVCLNQWVLEAASLLPVQARPQNQPWRATTSTSTHVCKLLYIFSVILISSWLNESWRCTCYLASPSAWKICPTVCTKRSRDTRHLAHPKSSTSSSSDTSTSNDAAIVISHSDNSKLSKKGKKKVSKSCKKAAAAIRKSP